MRLRLICDPSRRAIVTELLESRDLGPDDGASPAMVERGMIGDESLALVVDPA